LTGSGPVFEVDGALEAKVDGFRDGVDADEAFKFSVFGYDSTTTFEGRDRGLADVASEGFKGGKVG
jgi:hypothetical protein